MLCSKCCLDIQCIVIVDRLPLHCDRTHRSTTSKCLPDAKAFNRLHCPCANVAATPSGNSSLAVPVPGIADTFNAASHDVAWREPEDPSVLSRYGEIPRPPIDTIPLIRRDGFALQEAIVSLSPAFRRNTPPELTGMRPLRHHTIHSRLSRPARTVMGYARVRWSTPGADNCLEFPSRTPWENLRPIFSRDAIRRRTRVYGFRYSESAPSNNSKGYPCFPIHREDSPENFARFSGPQTGFFEIVPYAIAVHAGTTANRPANSENFQRLPGRARPADRFQGLGIGPSREPRNTQSVPLAMNACPPLQFQTRRP